MRHTRTVGWVSTYQIVWFNVNNHPQISKCTYNYTEPTSKSYIKKTAESKYHAPSSGRIQQTHEKNERAVKIYPGKKSLRVTFFVNIASHTSRRVPREAYSHQHVAHTKATVKNFSRLIPPRLPIPLYCCECNVLKSAHRTRLAGQTAAAKQLELNLPYLLQINFFAQA